MGIDYGVGTRVISQHKGEPFLARFINNAMRRRSVCTTRPPLQQVAHIDHECSVHGGRVDPTTVHILNLQAANRVLV